MLMRPPQLLSPGKGCNDHITCESLGPALGGPAPCLPSHMVALFILPTLGGALGPSPLQPLWLNLKFRHLLILVSVPLQDPHPKPLSFLSSLTHASSFYTFVPVKTRCDFISFAYTFLLHQPVESHLCGQMFPALNAPGRTSLFSGPHTTPLYFMSSDMWIWSTK